MGKIPTKTATWCAGYLCAKDSLNRRGKIVSIKKESTCPKCGSSEFLFHGKITDGQYYKMAAIFGVKTDGPQD